MKKIVSRLKMILLCCAVFFLLFGLMMSFSYEETGITTYSKPPPINRSISTPSGQPASASEVPQQQRNLELREGMLLHEVQRIYGEGKRTKHVVANDNEHSNYDFELTEVILKASFVDGLLTSWRWFNYPPPPPPPPQLPPNTAYVSRAHFGNNWPLTVPDGFVECKNGYIALFHRGGMTWALNGSAKTFGYPEIDPIWKDNPAIPGLKIAITPLLDLALKQCHE